ncbi:MAG: hypothetical protein JO057_11990 [Chloroflexi bacterium]|nr:hypothetical protein [Chloroflexota bacterium]
MQLIPHSLGRLAIATGAVLVLGGSAVGISVAQAQSTPTPTPTAPQQAYQKFLGSLASKLGVSTQTLQSDISQARQDAGLPANGGFGRGPGGPGQGQAQGQGQGQGPRGGFGFGFAALRQGLDVAAQTMHISTQQLQSELPGKSLAQVAGSHNSSGDAVAAALKSAANTRIDQAVTNGRLSADQANTMKTNIDNRIDQLVNQTLPQGAFQHRGGPGGQQQGQSGA